MLFPILACVFHGRRVAGASALARGVRVRVGALRQAQGERIWEGRGRWGVGDAMGDGGASRRAPLDSCLRRNDARGGVREGREVGTPRAAHLPWVPARAGTTMGGVVGRVGARGWCQGGWPVARSRGRAVREPPLRPGSLRGRGCESCCARGPFVCPQDRLRADGFGKRACSGGEGDAMGGVVGCVGARGSGQGGWPVARSRGRAVREPPLRPGWAHEGGGDAGAAGGGAPFECPQDRLRQGQGERVWEGRVRWGVGDAMGGFCQVIEVLAVNQHYCTHKQKTPAPGVSTCEPKGRARP